MDNVVRDAYTSIRNIDNSQQEYSVTPSKKRAQTIRLQRQPVGLHARADTH